MPTAAELLHRAKTLDHGSQRELELLVLRARGEKETEEGKGDDLDTVFAKVDALLKQIRRWESVSKASEDPVE